jgi:hypothetical protein
MKVSVDQRRGGLALRHRARKRFFAVTGMGGQRGQVLRYAVDEDQIRPASAPSAFAADEERFDLSSVQRDHAGEGDRDAGH